MRWTVHGERTLYDTPWVRLRSLDVEQPDGARTDYHVVRLRDLAVAAAVDEQQRVLMMWRHRFVTDTWAWELPMGLVEDGESPEIAAARELEEETGWRPQAVSALIHARSRRPGSPTVGTSCSARTGFVVSASPPNATSRTGWNGSR